MAARADGDDVLTSDEEEPHEEPEQAQEARPEYDGPPVPTSANVPSLDTLMKVDDEMLKRNLFEKGLPSEARGKQELCEDVRAYWALPPIAMTPPVHLTPDLEESTNNQMLVCLLKEKRGVSISIFMKNKKVKALLTTTDLWELRLAAAARSRPRAPRQTKAKELAASSEELRRENESLRHSLVAQDAMIGALRAEIAAIKAQAQVPPQDQPVIYGDTAFQ